MLTPRLQVIALKTPMAFARQHMLFQRYQSRKIEIDTAAVSSSSPEVAQRLDRIASNYQILDELLAEVENKFAVNPFPNDGKSDSQPKSIKPKPR